MKIVGLNEHWIDYLKYLALQRHNLHSNQKSSRPLSKDYELIGLAGEVAFAIEYGFSPDLALRIEGDNRQDFEIDSVTLDVKTALKPYNLLREKDKKHADVLILAGFKEPNEVIFYGWEFDTEMVKQPYRDFGYGVINHFKSAQKLKPMEDLEQRLKKRRKKMLDLLSSDGASEPLRLQSAWK
jgi:hypothetical protein